MAAYSAIEHFKMNGSIMHRYGNVCLLAHVPRLHPQLFNSHMEKYELKWEVLHLRSLYLYE